MCATVVGSRAALIYTTGSAMRTIVVVGLGNPGPGYARTRHNVGFRCVDSWAQAKHARFSRTACSSRLAEVQVGDVRVVLAKPRTFMNLSGKAASGLIHSYRIPVEDLVVVYDDVDLPPGRLRVRSSGGPGGHNGVRSIIAALNSERFPRVRVGIGKPKEPVGDSLRDEYLVDYVLGRFAPDEERVIDDAVARVNDVLDCIVEEGVEAAMNRYNSVV